MGARRRIAALVLLALPLAAVPFGLAAGKPSETLEGTLRTWHGDTFSTPVGVGAGVDTITDRPGRGTFTYQVRARDAAGNVSGLTAGATVST